MQCPRCKNADTKVVDSRLVSDGNAVRRRRQCLECEMRFTTYEKFEWILPKIVKRDGVRESYNEAKLRSGLERALEKRPVSTDDLEAAIDRIKLRLHSYEERECPAQQVGEWVMNELRELDQVAYVRFASVYRSFQDVEAFKDEIDKLLSKPR